MHSERFIKGTERLIDPITVGSSHFMQQLIGKIPLRAQRKMLERASGSIPYMGFVVEPYATFLFYELSDVARASALLPHGFRLARTRIFEGEEAKHYAIISFFRVHTSTFWGARAEYYLVAEDERTGLLSWVIVDYLSDTISYDRAHGLRGPSAPHAVVTTTADGRAVIDVNDTEGDRGVSFEMALENSRMRPLDHRLWVEGNLSIAYGPQLSPDGASTFSLTFSPSEMENALEVPMDNLTIEYMSWHDDILADRPSTAVCFPYAQHLLSDSPGTASNYSSAAQLEQALCDIDFENMPRFSTASTKRGAMVGAAVSLGAIVILSMTLALAIA